MSNTCSCTTAQGRKYVCLLIVTLILAYLGVARYRVKTLQIDKTVGEPHQPIKNTDSDKNVSKVGNNSTEAVKYILLWNSFFGDPSYHLTTVRTCSKFLTVC